MTDTVVDIALVLGDDNIYDVAIGDDGDFVPCYGFDTSIIMSLFSEQRADLGEVFQTAKARGWIGNETPDIPGFEVGSKLWLQYQQRKTIDTKNAIVAAAKDALSWLVPDYLSEIVITGQLEPDGISLSIVPRYLSGETDKLLYRLWQLTGSE